MQQEGAYVLHLGGKGEPSKCVLKNADVRAMWGSRRIRLDKPETIWLDAPGFQAQPGPPLRVTASGELALTRDVLAQLVGPAPLEVLIAPGNWIAPVRLIDQRDNGGSDWTLVFEGREELRAAL